MSDLADIGLFSFLLTGMGIQVVRLHKISDTLNLQAPTIQATLPPRDSVHALLLCAESH